MPSNRLNFIMKLIKDGVPGLPITLLEIQPTQNVEAGTRIDRGTSIKISNYTFYTAATVIMDNQIPKRVLAIGERLDDYEAYKNNIDRINNQRQHREWSIKIGGVDYNVRVIENVICATIDADETGGMETKQINDLIEYLMPVIHFHENERFFPIGYRNFFEERRTYYYKDIDADGQQFRNIDNFINNSDDFRENSFLTNSEWIDNNREIPNRERCSQLFPYEKNNYTKPEYQIVINSEFKLLREALYQNLRTFIYYLYSKINNDPNLETLAILRDEGIQDEIQRLIKMESVNKDILCDYIHSNPLFIKDPHENSLYYQDVYYLLKLCVLESTSNIREGCIGLEPQLYNYLELQKERDRVLSWLVDNDVITEKIWDVIRGYGLIVYYLIYPFNDWCIWGGVNDHEGDFEGFGIFINRDTLNGYIHGSIEINQISPDYIVTLAHKESDELDSVARWSDRVLRHEDNAVHVYVALGSHATYLEPGDHWTGASYYIYEEPVEFFENSSIIFGIFLCLTTQSIWVCIASLIASIFISEMCEWIEVLVTDKCSDNGFTSTGQCVISNDNVSNIYQEMNSSPEKAMTKFALRIFPGLFGADVRPGFSEEVEFIGEFFLEALSWFTGFFGNLCIEEGGSTFKDKINRLVRSLAKYFEE